MKPPYAWPDPDRDYQNGAFVPGADALPALWEQQATAFRAALGTRLHAGLTYGTGARHRFDLMLPERDSGRTLVFVHGGYWMAFGRSDWSHFAAGALARGWAVAMPSYTLAPEVRIARMTTEIAAACRAVHALRPAPLVVTGHSAGGHLAARMGGRDLDLPVARVVPISPLSELGPLMATAMNARLRITPEEAAAESPARLPLRPGTSAHVWVGGAERPAFLWQARTLAEEWDCPLTLAPGRHHFDVIEDLQDPGSPLLAAILS